MQRTDTIIRRFGTRLHSLRTERGLSQEALASAARLHPNFIGALERGTKQPTLTSMEQLARGLRVTLITLVDFPDSASKKHDRATEEIALIVSQLKRRDLETLRKIRRILDVALS